MREASAMPGLVHSLQLSSRGFPKEPVAAAVLGPEGLVGDTVRDRRHHGGPERALCLWSLEVIEVLAAAGHPVRPGDTGENLTLAGLHWAALVPGVRLRIGGEVELQIASYCAPCRTIRHCFRDEDFTVISQKLAPGTSRLYARVLRPGALAIGDAVLVRPEGT